MIENELKKIADLACLKIDESNLTQLCAEVCAIMDFVDELREVDTTEVAPLLHPFNLLQRMRHDVVTESSVLEELADIAPAFDHHLYLVPKVIETGS